MLETVPVSAGLATSVAVIVCVPTVISFTFTVATPFTTAVSAGRGGPRPNGYWGIVRPMSCCCHC